LLILHGAFCRAYETLIFDNRNGFDNVTANSGASAGRREDFR
jgi:hypothetical protein